ncbi:MAG: efflux RND transporter periplasmic adaptor subunit [Gammaproteobacteria bacterium]|nr:efflux RND transporter periplasmic adaptor subunit [Gammaproteobacteria bacterium]MCP5137346.1 efflux RND transporter periplasmic adaptor subunit [Gammaproteobacteria bacterium]
MKWRSLDGGQAVSFLGTMFAVALWAMPVAAEDVAARLAWANEVQLGPQVSGVVVAIPVATGQRVDAGETLLRLDDRRFRAQLGAAQARLNAAKPAYEEAVRHTERGAELYDRGALSGVEADQRKIAEAASRAEYDAAVAARDLARLNLEYSVVQAPFPARVTAIDAVVGQNVVTNFEAKPLLTVIAVGRMRAAAQIDANQLAGITPGGDVQIKVAGQAYTGRVVALGVSASAAGTYRLEVEFAHDPAQALRPGQDATIVLP